VQDSCLIFETTSLLWPFQGEYDASLMYSILNDEAEAVQKYHSDVSNELVHVLYRTLDKDPEDRYY
jgi:hypothetical protein